MPCFIFELKNHLICSVSGKDAERYLQGRLTQDIKSLQEPETAASLLLSPQGKIQGKFVIQKQNKGFLLISDPADYEEFVSNLLRFKVADDVSVEFLNEKYCLFSIQGENSKKIRDKLAQNSFNILSHQRSAEEGFDILIENEKRNKFLEQLQAYVDSGCLSFGNEKMWRIFRIEALAPEMRSDLSEEIIATDIPHHDLISLSKGCYVGQETVEMSTTRGRPNKILLKLQSEGLHKLPAKTELLDSREPSAKRAGFITSLETLEEKNLTICLAFVKNKLADKDIFYAKDIEFKLT